MEPTAADFDPGAVFAGVAGQTHAGQRRSENQDNFVICDLAADDGAVVLRPQAATDGDALAATLSLGENGALLLVADGMGGAAGGRLASGLACSFVLAELQEGWSAGEQRTARRFAFRLREAVEKANRRIHEHARRNPECAGMGTTATVAGVLSGSVYIAQVGDSRAYLIRGGRATQLTRDQSLVQQMIDAGALTPEEAERSAHGNVILQALGVEPIVAVELTSQQLRRGDAILLCSDGLHRVVRPNEIADAVGRLAEPELVCAELVALANSRGGPDNVTVVVARLDGAGLASPQPWDDVGGNPVELPQAEDG
jgi:PPM family protein phosphatase